CVRCRALCSFRLCGVCLSFFFQAEDGIRDRNVTGVQTCALPIFSAPADCFLYLMKLTVAISGAPVRLAPGAGGRSAPGPPESHRSEERRVGKEGGSQWAGEQEKKERRGSQR